MLALFVKVSTMYRPQLFVYERSAILFRAAAIFCGSQFRCPLTHIFDGDVIQKYSINSSTISM